MRNRNGRRMLATTVVFCIMAAMVLFPALNAQAAGPRISTGLNHTVALKADGHVLAAGSDAYGQTDVITNPAWANVTAVSAGRIPHGCPQG